MKDLYPNLHQFFEAHFHKNWRKEAVTPVNIVKRYRDAATLEEIEALVKELHHLLIETSTEKKLTTIVRRLGNHYNPVPDGKSDREWLAHICRILAIRGSSKLFLVPRQSAAWWLNARLPADQ